MSAPKVTSRAINATDVQAFYGPEHSGTLRGIAFESGGNLVGIAGVRLQGGFWVAFSDIHKDANLPAITIWRCAKQVVKEVVSKMRAPVFSVVDRDNRLGRKWATNLGFRYVCDQNEREALYKWTS